MKKHTQYVFIVAMISLGGANAFGQVENLSENVKGVSTPGTHLGLLLNMVTTNLDYGHANNALSDYKKSNVGLQAGLSFQAGITSRISLLSELYFIMKGGRLQANNALTGSETSLRLYTLELPVLARFHFGKFYLNAGPSLGYNLSGRMKIEGSSKAISFNGSPDGFRRFDAAIQMGGGYKFKIKQKSLALDVRYSKGLTNISRADELYNRYLNISIQFINPWKTNPLALKKN